MVQDTSYGYDYKKMQKKNKSEDLMCYAKF